ALGAREILRRGVAAFLALSRVVDEELRHLAERATFFSRVRDDAGAARLRGANANFDAVREVRAARADVRAEDVRAVALVVHAAREPLFRIADLAEIYDEVDSNATDRWQKNVEIGTRDELREHAARLLEEAAPQIRFAH